MNISILGGGLSAISLAYFLQNDKNISKITIIEKEKELGGLCRTLETNKIKYDIGPHIIFSKDTEILELILNLLGKNKKKLRRSNRIIYKDRFLQYPFENDLSKLDKEDLEKCIDSFINNPYENSPANNMLQFFLKTFGEGITNIYLKPYNEKIWKFSPSEMDTQMVERIPKPQKEDILNSAKGKTIDGYLHQLYFFYPKKGGTKEIINSFVSKFTNKISIYTNNEIQEIHKENNKFLIKTNNNSFISDNIISTIPLNYLTEIYKKEKPIDISNTAKKLKYNSIAICLINVKKDKSGNNYAFMTSDKNVIFHRISKLDFMGENYHLDNTVTYMAEITYRRNDIYENLTDNEIICNVINGMKKIKFIDNEADVNFSTIKRFEYSYVIYDLEHRKNVDKLKNYFKEEGITLNGRFGTFEYLNMDAIIRQSLNLAKNYSYSSNL